MTIRNLKVSPGDLNVGDLVVHNNQLMEVVRVFHSEYTSARVITMADSFGAMAVVEFLDWDDTQVNLVLIT